MYLSWIIKSVSDFAYANSAVVHCRTNIIHIWFKVYQRSLMQHLECCKIHSHIQTGAPTLVMFYYVFPYSASDWDNVIL